jgi:hypothetical protein
MKKLLVILILIIIAAALILVVNNFTYVGDPYTLLYEGEYRQFRANLIEANKTPVYPSESAVREVLLSPDVYKIQIAFIPNNTENAFYLADTFEVVNKIGLVYRHLYKSQVSTFQDTDNSSCLLFFDDGQTRCFKSTPINSTDELVPTPVEPVILFLGPSQTDRTMISVSNSLITLEGGNFSEVDRKYTDLDLAVDKMLLILMTGS